MSQPERFLLIILLLSGLFAVPVRGDETVDDEDASTGQLITGIVVNHYGAGVEGATIRIESPDASAEDPPLAEGTANAMGEISLRLRDPPGDRVRVRIRAEGYNEWVGELDVSDPEFPPFIDATMEGASKINGYVRTAGSEEPVPGASVHCSNGGRNLYAETDDDGWYLLENVYPGSATLTVMAGGFGIERRSIMVDLEAADADIALLPERPVELRVVTNNGDPAPEVTVEAIILPVNYPLLTTTDDKGRASLHGVSTAAMQLQIRLNGPRYVHMPFYSESVRLPPVPPTEDREREVPPVRKQLTVTLGSTVKGRVLAEDTGEPIVGVRVIAGREVSSGMPMAWTASDGTYELTGIRPGIVTISYQHANYATAIREADLFTGKTETINLKLSTGRPIGGTVVDGEGEPIDQVWVTAEEWKGYATLGLRAITTDDGRFTLPHAPPGEVRCSFFKPGYGEEVRQVLATGRTDYRIVLKASSPEPAPAMAERGGKIAVGEPVPDLTMTATDGTEFELAELRGKYVLIDCWASWCGPCIGEVPHLKAVREATRERADFVMIGVSLDQDRDAFRRAVEKHELNWPQVCGEDSGAREVFETFDGRGIPYICLIGPDGRIVAQHLRGPQIVEQVRKHLGD